MGVSKKRPASLRSSAASGIARRWAVRRYFLCPARALIRVSRRRYRPRSVPTKNAAGSTPASSVTARAAGSPVQAAPMRPNSHIGPRKASVRARTVSSPRATAVRVDRLMPMDSAKQPSITAPYPRLASRALCLARLVTQVRAQPTSAAGTAGTTAPNTATGSASSSPSGRAAPRL